MKYDLINNGSQTVFEELKRNKGRGDYWSSRELAKILGYSEYRHFLPVIEKAKQACTNSGQVVKDHFEEVLDMVKLGSTASRQIKDIYLSRYACYLVTQNADPSKKIVAIGQTYFAVQTRRQEVAEQQHDLEKRVYIRTEVTKQNKILFGSAQKAGVNNFGLFNDAGYKGLYGKSLRDVEKYKGVGKGELLDRAGATELAANLFRITQTDEKIKKDGIQGEQRAINTHNMVGGKVRETIREIGGKLPEELPPEVHIKEVKKVLKRLGTSEHNIIDINYNLLLESSSPEKIYINIPPSASMDQLRNLREFLTNCGKGKTTVVLIFGGSGDPKVIELDTKIKIDENLQRDVKAILE